MYTDEIPANKKCIDPSFPLLARHKTTKYITLFSSENAGMVVHDPRKDKQEVGYYSSCWRDVRDEYYWEILTDGHQVIIRQ